MIKGGMSFQDFELESTFGSCSVIVMFKAFYNYLMYGVVFSFPCFLVFFRTVGPHPFLFVRVLKLKKSEICQGSPL